MPREVAACKGAEACGYMRCAHRGAHPKRRSCGSLRCLKGRFEPCPGVPRNDLADKRAKKEAK